MTDSPSTPSPRSSEDIRAAITALEADPDIRVMRRSRLYRTPPWGVTDQDWFANACVGITTTLAPRELLKRCQAIEAEMGRVRKRHWGPRIIDVDILLYGEQEIDEPDLAVPHPRIRDRAFVLAPLADIAADTVLNGKSVAEWLKLTEQAGVEPWPGAPAL